MTSTTLTLTALATDLTAATGRTFTVERLGGNVYGLTDFYVTVTIDGGQCEVDGTAELLICAFETGTIMWRGEVASVAEATHAVVSIAG